MISHTIEPNPIEYETIVVKYTTDESFIQEIFDYVCSDLLDPANITLFNEYFVKFIVSPEHLEHYKNHHGYHYLNSHKITDKSEHVFWTTLDNFLYENQDQQAEKYAKIMDFKKENEY
jgi:hypothetical protein